ncbi:aldehyde dehydrogenase family protein [Bradyrhizobium sp. AUGA SZCCT0240]|uniref:aldehyde dehydrogenase family protein n=1 Tax=Bradyrhizobium sp. AUGA SZCCT0240 TaxID=2807669 RepID=UPI001BA6D396|nr:aldehyde dehydrogenase family protein [Bradyrhizobium sp. AUGA SZCCT0240]MBR1256362.1 aldehyde dehydrogenase family protein [Bradyrhizobium sp. AUGA SZCCT0240]
MNEFKLLIGGRLVSTTDTVNVINPATEEVLAACPVASQNDVEETVAAAKAAFPGWSRAPLAERRDAMRAIADVLEQNASELARLLTQEQGKPLGEATREVMATSVFFRNFCNIDLPAREIRSESRRVEMLRKPLGVVAAIVPWNFPLVLMAMKVPPALLTGNTVILKPAPSTPLTTLRIGELIKDVLPPGVLNIISGNNELGAWLTAHPDVRKISFTGSTATGARVMQGAAATLKRITLELGGNDAAIVLDDVNPKEVAPKLFQGAFQNNGQVCIAIKRLYVHDSIYDEVCNELAALADSAVVGDGLKQGTQFGPLQNKPQYERVLELIADAKRYGKAISGGESPEKAGYFIRPTIVRDIQDGSRLVDEEQFGPVLPVIRYTEPEDALSRANASPYGLGSSVWSADPARAYELAKRLDAGTVWVNKHGELALDTPFGGAKQSGIGNEFGEEGMAEFTQLHVLNMAV